MTRSTSDLSPRTRSEDLLAVIAHIVIPGLTLEQYDQLRDIAGWLDEPSAGEIAHLAWSEPDCLAGTGV